MSDWQNKNLIFFLYSGFILFGLACNIWKITIGYRRYGLVHSWLCIWRLFHWQNGIHFIFRIGSGDIDTFRMVKANEHGHICGAWGLWFNLEKDIGFLHNTFLTNVVSTCNILHHFFCFKQICYVGSSWNKPKTFYGRSEPNQKRQRVRIRKCCEAYLSRKTRRHLFSPAIVFFF